MNKEAMLEFSNKNGWKYKGVLSAIVDQKGVEDIMEIPMPLMRNYRIQVVGFIWTDENEEWHMHLLLKHPIGSRTALGKCLGKNCNETKMLHEIYKFPLKEKFWFTNKDGTLESLIKLLREKDMIENERIMTNE